MAGRVIVDPADNAIAEALVKGPRLEAVGFERRADGAPRAGIGFGLLHQPRAVPLAARGFADPEIGYVQPVAPELAEEAAQHLAARAAQHEIDRAPIGKPAHRHAVEIETVGDEVARRRVDQRLELDPHRLQETLLRPPEGSRRYSAGNGKGYAGRAAFNRIARRLAEDQHPGAGGDEGKAGGTRNPSSERGKLFQEDDQRQQRDPNDVHHAADEQERHQTPAAADAIGAVAYSHGKAARHIAAETAIAHEETDRALALGKAHSL